MFKRWGLMNPFGINNTALNSIKQDIFRQISKRSAQLEQSKPLNFQFYKSNIEILQSSTNPFRRYKYFAYRFQSLSGSGSFNKRNLELPLVYKRLFRRSNTWKNYNKYYGNSNWDRLKGPAIFTAAFCVGTTLTVPYLVDYSPLAIFKRNPRILILSLIALNGAGFLMWKSPRLLPYLTKYGLLVKDNVYSNWSLLGAAFSHQSFMHLLINMFVLQSFGSNLLAILGASNFLIMYLNSAVISSFISLVIPTITRTSLAVGSLGASGAIFGVIGTLSYLIPKAPVAFFFIPIPGGAWFLFMGTIAYNVAGLFFRWGAHDYAAHLGGSLAGVVYGWYYTKKIQERRSRVNRFSYGF